MSKIPLSAQASAIDHMLRVLDGGAKPTPRERDLLRDRLKAAAASLRFIEGYEAEFRAFIAARNSGEAL